MFRTVAASSAFALLLCTAFARDSASFAPLPDLTSFDLARIDTSMPTPVSTAEAADALKDYDVVFFGEWHDHPGNHLAEMRLFRAIAGRVPKLALSMEMFERDVQPVMDDYMAGRIGEDAMIERARAWSNYAESYRPLVEFAKEKGFPLIAANAPASVVRCVGEDGPEFLSKLAPDKRGWAAAELHLYDGPYKDKFLRFLAESGSHGDEARDKSAGPSASDLRGFASQVTRDDTMAESIFQYLQKNPGSHVVHVTGQFHAEAFLGTVERLKLRAPQLKIAVVSAVQVDDPEHPALDANDVKSGTFAVLLRKTPDSYANEAEKKAAEDKIRGMIRNRRTCML